MRTGIYGGAFDPPHAGHLDNARTVCEALGLDRLIVIPSAVSPHKPRSPLSPPPEERLELCRMAFERVPGVQVSDIEILSSEISYTYVTLTRLRELWPDDEFCFIMGSDMLFSFAHWRKPDVICSIAEIVYLNRGSDEAELEACEQMLRRELGAKVTRVDNVHIDISSSRLRRLIPLGCSFSWLPEDVFERIIQKGLYDSRPDLTSDEAVLEWSLRRVSPKRAEHVKGCVLSALELADRFGAPRRSAFLAAALHDVTKEARALEQLQLCEKYGIIPDAVQKKNTQLLHALTGAAVAKSVLSMSDEVCEAIANHTTGRPEMSLLDKIICLADYIEPNRDFEGVEHIRELAKSDLDLALITALKSTAEHLKDREEIIHPMTAQTVAWLEQGKGL